MVGNPPKITVAKAVRFLKSGQFQPALKYLYYLKRNSEILSPTDRFEVEQNFILCLKILFDKQLAKAEEAVRGNDDRKSSVFLINLLDLQNSLYQFLNDFDKTLINNSKNAFKLFETWVFKVLTTIRSVELKRRHLERHFSEIINLFGYVSLLYTDFFLRIPQLTKFFNPNKSEFQKIQQYVEKEITYYLLDKFDQVISQDKIIQALETWQKIKNLIKEKENPKKITLMFQKAQMKLISKLAYIDLNHGDMLAQQHEYCASIQKYKSAYTKFHSIGDESHKKQAKTKFLEVNIQLGRWYENKAKELETQNDTKIALEYYEKAYHIFKEINAKKELTRISGEIHQFYEKQGDFATSQAHNLSDISPEELQKKVSYLNEAKYHYQKSENAKKIKKIQAELEKINKIRYKIISKAIQEARKKQNTEEIFLLLEELHLLSYEINMEKNTQKIAQEIEKLKPKVNWQKIEEMKKQKYFLHLDYQPQKLFQNQQENADLDNKTQILFSSQANKENMTQNMDLDLLPESIAPNLDTITAPFSKNTEEITNSLIDSTWFSSHESTQIIDPNQTRLISTTAVDNFVQDSLETKSLKKIYVYLKKHNQGKVLNQAEIEFLCSHGINLPTNSLYYFKFEKIPHQFYVYENPRGGPQVLMIPRNPLITRRAKLGEGLQNFQIYLTGNLNEDLLPQKILLSHLKLAQISNNWDDYLGSFQFSSLDIYVNFLNAVRLMNQQAEIPEIVKYMNASLVAEFINLPTPNMINFLEQFNSFTFIEEFYGFSEQINWLLFSIGLKWFYSGNLSLAATIWSMIEIS
ncbi:MAG: hypothetical protein ACTSUK_04580 [Promethearchaeota archaeon]